jgi:hypothetical protein
MVEGLTDDILVLGAPNQNRALHPPLSKEC